MHDPSLHLFVDDYHIRNAFCLKRELFPLRCDREPLLEDTPGRALAWGCVMLDEKRYRLWYQSVARIEPHALSQSGVWGKGEDFSFHPDASRRIASSQSPTTDAPPATASSSGSPTRRRRDTRFRTF